MPWLVWRAVRKNAMAAKGSTDCTTWLKLVDEIRKTPLHEPRQELSIHTKINEIRQMETEMAPI